MKELSRRALAFALRTTGLQHLPVTVRRGYSAGARWTLFPWSAYWRGGYEPEMEQALESLGDLTGKSCWDLGAHYGYYSVGLARRTGPTGQVAAFEPFPSSFARLERHRRMNGLTQLRVFPFAVSDVAGTRELFCDTSEGDTTVHLPYDNEARRQETPVMPVRTVRLDDLVAAGELRLPDVIKVDIEGHGHRALTGAAEALRRNRPVILMGFHSDREESVTRDLLSPLGYEWTVLGGPADGALAGRDCLLRPR